MTTDLTYDCKIHWIYFLPFNDFLIFLPFLNPILCVDAGILCRMREVCRRRSGRETTMFRWRERIERHFFSIAMNIIMTVKLVRRQSAERTIVAWEQPAAVDTCSHGGASINVLIQLYFLSF